MSDFYCDQIITGNVDVEKVYETELVLAFYHTKPYFEKHVVIIPKEHIPSLSKYSNNDQLNRDFFKAIIYVTKLFEEKYGGCRVSSNVGNYQTTKHLHWYVHYGDRVRTEGGEVIEK